jgi:hypothetical protein
MAEAIRRTAEAGAAVALTGRALAQLEAELGGTEAALLWLVDLATGRNKPVAVNLPTPDGGSQTIALSPRGWGEERLRGWLGGRAEQLAEMFGPLAGPPYRPDWNAAPAPKRAERRRRRKERRR